MKFLILYTKKLQQQYITARIRHRTAFSLIEMSLVLAFVGIIAGFVLSVRQTTTQKDCYTITKKQIEGIREAIERFAMTNDRFPAPARRYVGVDSTLYGREVTRAEQLANPAKGIEDPAGTKAGTRVLYGTIPFQAIGIPVANASDCWGNKFTYAVTQDLVDPTPVNGKTKFLDAATEGGIDIKTNNTVTQYSGAGYAIISHGADELGAVKDNYNDTSATPNKRWCTKVDGKLRTYNCAAVDGIVVSRQFNNGKDAADDQFFDDIINYRGPPWRNTCCPYWGTC